LNFLKNLNTFTEATQKEKIKEIWDVKGILKKHSNQEFKFDLRPLSNVKNDLFGKKGFINTKSDKMVFETDTQWIIIDTKELHEYIKKNKIEIVYLDNILNEFYWNIIINK
tara:strand:+ start:260 stop:592 length:333 start_codon:yes stop_codon:yes gene_type:complete